MNKFLQNLEKNIMEQIEKLDLKKVFKQIDIKYGNENQNEKLLDILIITELGNIFVEIKIMKENKEFYLNSSSIYWNLENVKLETQLLFLKLQTYILEYIHNNKTLVIKEMNTKYSNSNYEEKIKKIEEEGYKKLTSEELEKLLTRDIIELKDYYIELPIFLEIEKGQKNIKIEKNGENYIYEEEKLTKEEVTELLSQIYIKQTF